MRPEPAAWSNCERRPSRSEDQNTGAARVDQDFPGSRLINALYQGAALAVPYADPIYPCHHEPASAGEGSAFSTFPAESEQQIPRGLNAAKDDKSKRLIGATEVVPVTKHFKIDFSRSLFSRGRENACMKAALAAEGKTFPQHRALERKRGSALPLHPTQRR